MSLNLSVVKVEGKERTDLLDALRRLCEIDCDFSGENGPEYNWKETISKGFDSNADLVLDRVKDLIDDKEVINEFIKGWIQEDYYYHEYLLDVIYDDKGKAEVISLAVEY